MRGSPKRGARAKPPEGDRCPPEAGRPRAALLRGRGAAPPRWPPWAGCRDADWPAATQSAALPSLCLRGFVFSVPRRGPGLPASGRGAPLCATCAPWERPLTQSCPARRGAPSHTAFFTIFIVLWFVFFFSFFPSRSRTGAREVRKTPGAPRRPPTRRVPPQPPPPPLPLSAARSLRVREPRVRPPRREGAALRGARGGGRGRRGGRARARAARRAGRGDNPCGAAWETPGLGLRQRARHLLLASPPTPPRPPEPSGRGWGWCQQRRERSSGRHFTPAPAYCPDTPRERRRGAAPQHAEPPAAPRAPSHGVSPPQPQVSAGRGLGSERGWERAGPG